jgi:hypothetical protein
MSMQHCSLSPEFSFKLKLWKRSLRESSNGIVPNAHCVVDGGATRRTAFFYSFLHFPFFFLVSMSGKIFCQLKESRVELKLSRMTPEAFTRQKVIIFPGKLFFKVWHHLAKVTAPFPWLKSYFSRWIRITSFSHSTLLIVLQFLPNFPEKKKYIISTLP